MQHLTRMLILIAALLVAVQAQAQTVYQLQPESELWIEGTSNKSDWTVTAGTLSGQVDMEQDAIQAVTLTVPAEEIVSNKSSIMDRLMYKALNVEEHPEITYELTSVEGTPTGATFTLQTRGRLTIAGETREVEIPVEGEQLDDGQLRFTGSHTLLMTDYGMQPPTAMFGALHTGDEVTIHFNLVAAQK